MTQALQISDQLVLRRKCNTQSHACVGRPRGRPPGPRSRGRGRGGRGRGRGGFQLHSTTGDGAEVEAYGLQQDAPGVAADTPARSDAGGPEGECFKILVVETFCRPLGVSAVEATGVRCEWRSARPLTRKEGGEWSQSRIESLKALRIRV